MLSPNNDKLIQANHLKEQKQIEDMAADLHEELETENIPYHECYFMAQRLIKKGWIKPNEGSIVLSGLELADYKHYKEYTKSLAMVEKETTEKILNTDFFVFETENRSEEYQKGYMQAVRESRSRREELAKQCGVEIKN